MVVDWWAVCWGSRSSLEVERSMRKTVCLGLVSYLSCAWTILSKLIGRSVPR